MTLPESAIVAAALLAWLLWCVLRAGARPAPSVILQEDGMPLMVVTEGRTGEDWSAEELETLALALTPPDIWWREHKEDVREAVRRCLRGS